jgi:hypothetical protein
VSGQLVGEVIAARAGCLAPLSQGETLALIAIATRCKADTRQGWVTYAEIMATVGCSERTAQRIIAKLKKRGCIAVVKRGYKAPGQPARAPVYRVAEFRPPIVAEADAPSSRQTVPSSRQMETELPPNNGQAPATLGGTPTSLPTARNQRPLTNVATRAHAQDGFGQQAVAIVEDFVHGRLRKGGAKRVLVDAVGEGLRRGLAEDAVIGLITDWQKNPGWPSSYRLCTMLRTAYADGAP